MAEISLENQMVVKPYIWKSEAMNTDYARSIIEKLEKHFNRPIVGSITFGGMDFIYIDPAAVVQMMMKMESLQKQVDGEESRLKDLYKTLTGFSHE